MREVRDTPRRQKQNKTHATQTEIFCTFAAYVIFLSLLIDSERVERTRVGEKERNNVISPPPLIASLDKYTINTNDMYRIELVVRASK